MLELASINSPKDHDPILVRRHEEIVGAAHNLRCFAIRAFVGTWPLVRSGSQEALGRPVLAIHLPSYSL